MWLKTITGELISIIDDVLLTARFIYKQKLDNNNNTSLNGVRALTLLQFFLYVCKEHVIGTSRVCAVTLVNNSELINVLCLLLKTFFNRMKINSVSNRS